MIRACYNEREGNGTYYPEGSIQAALWLDSSYDIESQMKELTEKAGFTEDELRISVNWGYAVSSVDGVTVALGIGMLSIIMLSGYLIIYNIFYINVSTDIRYYGLLSFILGVIGVLNLINAMITSILARRQEFAMMLAEV